MSHENSPHSQSEKTASFDPDDTELLNDAVSPFSAAESAAATEQIAAADDAMDSAIADAANAAGLPTTAAVVDGPDVEGYSFFVVGIGASAGGLRALEDFFAHIPQDSEAAFVIIQHLSPDYKSLMKELLARCTRMAIHRIEDGMLLVPKAIYLIPPGQNLTVESSRLRLTKQERLSHRPPNFPIDLFFASLAQDFGEQVISIVLSGTGSDGSEGIQAVHKAGGIVLVQEPETAEFDGMPLSAIATGVVDRTLSPAQLAQLAYRIISSPAQRSALGPTAPFMHVQEQELRQILTLLSTHENIDLSRYKTSTLIRRIQRRCFLSGIPNLSKYLTNLEGSAEARRTLRNDLLISVTCFFRDTQVWQYLQQEILPPLITEMSDKNPLRFWVSACATGEEAYSLAILIDECAQAQNKAVNVKIFATDINPDCLEIAAQGAYPASIADHVTAARLEQYFTRRGSSYGVVRRLRKMIVFAPHDLVKDAGFSRIHLAMCRNVLIYMQPSLQQRVISSLHFSLQSRGILVMGESESLGRLDDEFIIRNRRFNIYEKRRDVKLLQPNLSKLPQSLHPFAKSSSDKVLHTRSAGGSDRDSGLGGQDMRIQQALRLLMNHREGCCLLLNDQGLVLQVFGATPEILPPPDGPVSNEAVHMVAPSLQLPLNAALNHARKTDKFFHYSAIPLELSDRTIKVSLQVAFYRGNRLVEDFFVVVIEPEPIAANAYTDINQDDLESAATQRIVELEYELQRSRESLQATIEELETTNEEQQATNEELIAFNEELQGMNEELQSVNEELYTVNAEYQSKIQELTQLNHDIDNLLTSTDIGVIYLDVELRVRKYTPSANNRSYALTAE